MYSKSNFTGLLTMASSQVVVATLLLALLSIASCLPPQNPAVVRTRDAARPTRDLQGSESYYGGFGYGGFGYGYGGFGYGYGYGYPYYGGYYGGYYPYFGGYYF